MSEKSSLWEIHSAVLLFGLAGLFGKWLQISPFTIVFGRVFFASLALSVILLTTKKGLLPGCGPMKALFPFLGLLLAVHWVCFFQSIQVSTVAIGLLSYSSFPLFTVFLEPLIRKENFNFRNMLFALVCLFGIFLIVPRFSWDNQVFQGVLWGLAAGLTFAVLTILNRTLSQHYAPLHIALYQDGFAALFLLPVLPAAGLPGGARDLLSLIVLGVVCTAAAHSLFIQGMQHVQAQRAALISSLEPVYGILLAALVLNEIPGLRTMTGGAIILGTALAVTLKR